MIIEKSLIKDILLDNKYISNVSIDASQYYNERYYQWLIYCNIDCNNSWIPIIIGIPINWELKLFDFYIIENKVSIPHIDKRGKLCLYDLEGTIIFPEFSGLLNQCINVAKKIIDDGLAGINKIDYIREFNSYFGESEDIGSAEVVLPDKKNISNIKFCNLPNNKKKNKYSKTNKLFFSSSCSEDFILWNRNYTQKNGIYCYIEPSEYIFPPGIVENDLIDYLNRLLIYVEADIFKTCKDKCSNEILLIFEILQPNGIVTNCGFFIKSSKFEINNHIVLKCVNLLQLVLINRLDRTYLQSRTTVFNSRDKNKPILLIGCGSIGGYVFHNLLKLGYTNITIVDPDIIKPENIYRHLLGIDSLYKYKVAALFDYAKKIAPNIVIRIYKDNIEDVLYNFNLNLNSYNFIISAVGNHTINYWLNRYIVENVVMSTAFYIWNEPLDLGCHIARINIKNGGDYRNIITLDSNGVHDLSSYVKEGQDLVKRLYGCNGSYIPYSATASIDTSLLFSELLKREELGLISKNILLSKKGDGIYFKKSHYFVSKRYENQEGLYNEISLENLFKNGSS